jgi:hypothetical protein
MDLPYFDDVSLKELVKARADEAAFTEFQVALDKAFSEIGKVEAQNAQARTDEICRDLIHAPLAKIDKQMKSLNRNVWIDAIPLAGSLLMSIMVAGPTLAGYATGTPLPGAGVATMLESAGLLGVSSLIAKAYRGQKDTEDNIRGLPSYFYWKVTEKAAKRRSK